MEWDNLSIGRILARRPRNNPDKPLDRASLQYLKEYENLIGAEIGVSAGDNAFDMLVKLDIQKLYLIDPYKGFRQWTQTKMDEHWDLAHSLLKTFNEKIEWIKKSSKEASSHIGDGELHFAYIDGSHDYGDVRDDLEIYWHKVKIGGLVCGDNFEYNAVGRAVVDFAKSREEDLCFHDNLFTKSTDFWFWKETF